MHTFFNLKIIFQFQFYSNRSPLKQRYNCNKFIDKAKNSKWISLKISLIGDILFFD